MHTTKLSYRRMAAIIGAVLTALCIIVSTVGCTTAPVPIVPPPYPIRWLAVGDSFSSGQGLSDVDEPTCQRATGTNGHTSKAWAVKTREALGSALPLAADQGGFKGFDFEACTGAKTGDLFSKEWSPTGNGRFELITFSFGGNNVGFAPFINECVRNLVNGCPAQGLVEQEIINLGVKYQTFLKEVATQVSAHGGNVIVVGYPELIEDPQFWPQVNQALGKCHGIRSGDARMIRGLAGLLNKTIADAVTEMNSKAQNIAANPELQDVRFTFVDVNTGQPAQGVGLDSPNLYEPSQGPRHNLCAGDEWLNGITTTGLTFNTDRSFHPTQAGHDATAKLVEARIRSNQVKWDRLPSTPKPYPTTTTTTPTANPPQLDGNGRKTIQSVSGGNRKCDTAEWDFVITQIARPDLTPPTLIVGFPGGGRLWNVRAVLPSSDPTMVHYKIGASTPQQVAGDSYFVLVRGLPDVDLQADAQIYPEWSGQFLLLSGPCTRLVTTTEHARTCNSTEWEFIVDQVSTELDVFATAKISYAVSGYPNSIGVFNTRREKISNGVASFKFAPGSVYTSSPSDVSLVSAEVGVSDSWHGQFYLNRGPCPETTLPPIVPTT
jgi:hypothetical protein